VSQLRQSSLLLLVVSCASGPQVRAPSNTIPQQAMPIVGCLPATDAFLGVRGVDSLATLVIRLQPNFTQQPLQDAILVWAEFFKVDLQAMLRQLESLDQTRPDLVDVQVDRVAALLADFKKSFDSVFLGPLLSSDRIEFARRARMLNDAQKQKLILVRHYPSSQPRLLSRQYQKILSTLE
jgi:hypothetical protein